MVLSDEEKASQRCQVSVRELNASEPFDEVSKEQLVEETIGFKL
jgi:hypothetical protein